ncbi:hypothetical protein Tco_0484412 [Tanacetum coccineum]
MQDDSIPVQRARYSSSVDDRLLTIMLDSRKDWWKPLPEEEIPVTPEPTWTIPSFNKLETLNDILKCILPKDVVHLQFQMEECHKMLTDQVDWANPEGDQVRINVNRPLPLGGPPGHVTIQTQFFFNKDLEYLWYGSKGSCPALSISKMKAANYPDFGLELLVPEQMWIDDVCTYDISAKYGISHWWFTRQKFYIDRHDSPSRRKDVRTHMRILSVVRIKAYSRYGDFEDLNLLLLQGHLDHLSGLDKRMLSMCQGCGHKNLVIRTRVEDSNSVNNNEGKIMRFNKIYKFSDGTLTRILEALAYRVKEFKIKRLNPSMNTRNVECFVGVRVQ